VSLATRTAGPTLLDHRAVPQAGRASGAPVTRPSSPADTLCPTSTTRRGPRVTIRLPALTPQEAWAVAALLERLQRALWRVHGEALADYQGALFPDHPPRQEVPPVRAPRRTRRTGTPTRPGDEEIPF
jgi:hypothetical protein